jgi:hypothetical protein
MTYKELVFKLNVLKMKGVNKAIAANRNLSEINIRAGTTARRPCIFLSHQKADAPACKIISTYFEHAEIDYYFDENDHDLKFSRQTNDPVKVTESIKKGMDQSTHMLCIISKNTLLSKWVPFEVGYGFSQKMDLGILTLRGISDADLPEYVFTAKIRIRGIQSINNYISQITNVSTSLMESRNLVKSFTTFNHPLESIMDKFQ